MDLSIYLAATGAELRGMDLNAQKLAWMACQFSLSGTGISGIPASLPPESILMLTDEMPIQQHDPHRVADELLSAAENLKCSAILLDFQRPKTEEAATMAETILHAAALPVIISQPYGTLFSCPVLISPSPLWLSLETHLAPWQDRQIWLEAILEDAIVTVTKDGSQYSPCVHHKETPFYNEALCVSYAVEEEKDCLQFYLHRGKEELKKLLQQANNIGVKNAIGLYQQLGK